MFSNLSSILRKEVDQAYYVKYTTTMTSKGTNYDYGAPFASDSDGYASRNGEKQ